MSLVESEFMVEMEGTEVTTESTSLGLERRTWVIQEKLSEQAILSTKEDVRMGWGPATAAAKFQCYDKADPTRKPAFMRIYRQIPAGGTVWASRETRIAQAEPDFLPPELHAFKTFRSQNCMGVPELLGIFQGQQPDDALLPGGFTHTIVREIVPGSPLTEEFFWGLDRIERDLIRQNFRSAYTSVLACGISITDRGPERVIYDASTGNLKLVGFVFRYPDIVRSFKSYDFIEFGLATEAEDGDGDEDDPDSWIY